MQVDQEEDWAEGIKTALRFKPRFIFVGEVRTAAAASQLIQAACSGHLVICTLHGGSVQESLSRLIQIASDEMGDTARNLLADSLVAVMHQRLVNGRPIVEMISADGDANASVRAAIRERKIEQLGFGLSSSRGASAGQWCGAARRCRSSPLSSRPQGSPLPHAVGQPYGLTFSIASEEVVAVLNADIF